MKYFIIIRGSAGSGKSSVARLLQKQLKGKTAIFCPDYFYWDVCGNDENPDIIYEALHRLIDLYLKNGYNVILEGILSSKHKNGKLRINQYLNFKKIYNIKIKLFYLSTSFNTSYQRNKNRKIVINKKIATKIYNKSVNARHKLETEIDIEKNTVNKISKIILEISKT